MKLVFSFLALAVMATEAYKGQANNGHGNAAVEQGKYQQKPAKVKAVKVKAVKVKAVKAAPAPSNNRRRRRRSNNNPAPVAVAPVYVAPAPAPCLNEKRPVYTGYGLNGRVCYKRPGYIGYERHTAATAVDCQTLCDNTLYCGCCAWATTLHCVIYKGTQRWDASPVGDTRNWGSTYYIKPAPTAVANPVYCVPTPSPTKYPTAHPTNYPTAHPTNYPTASPTSAPTGILSHNKCHHTRCTYTISAVNGHARTFVESMPRFGEKWHCEKSGNGCKCVCHSSLSCNLRHHHQTGYKKTFTHC